MDSLVCTRHCSWDELVLHSFGVYHCSFLKTEWISLANYFMGRLFQNGCSNSADKSTTQRTLHEYLKYISTAVLWHIGLNMQLSWRQEEWKICLITYYLLAAMGQACFQAIRLPLADTMMCNTDKGLVGVPFNGVKAACHFNYLSDENPPTLTVSTVHHHLNMAVPTGHAQSMMEIWELLWIWKKFANFWRWFPSLDHMLSYACWHVTPCILERVI